jgi:hypothetical protein
MELEDGNRDARNVIRHVRSEARALVLRVNPGITGNEPGFAARAEEVARQMVSRLVAENAFGGRMDLARKIERASELEGIAWQD